MCHRRVLRQDDRQRACNGYPAHKPQRIDALAEALNGHQWHRFTLQEGTKGPLVTDIAAIRVTVVEDSLPGREGWPA